MTAEARHPKAADPATDRQLDSTGLKRLHRQWRHRTERPLALILDGLASPTNVGSIVRSSAAYGVDTIWLAGPTPAPSPKVAMGTERYLDLHRAADTVAAIAQARQRGFAVIALELTAHAAALHDAAIDPRAAIALVVGHEDHGVGKAALAACDGAVHLPLVGKVGSLNVAVATAVALAELRRQEWHEQHGPGPG